MRESTSIRSSTAAQMSSDCCVPPKSNGEDNVPNVEMSSSSSSSEDVEILRLSVADKALLFMHKQDQAKMSAVPERFRKGNLTSRRKLQRSRTQPVTSEEVKIASSISSASADKNSSRVDSESDSDPCRLSLADRVRLFNRKVIGDEVLPSRKLSLAGECEESVAINQPAKKVTSLVGDRADTHLTSDRAKLTDIVKEQQRRQLQSGSTNPSLNASELSTKSSGKLLLDDDDDDDESMTLSIDGHKMDTVVANAACGIISEGQTQQCFERRTKGNTSPGNLQDLVLKKLGQRRGTLQHSRIVSIRTGERSAATSPSPSPSQTGSDAPASTVDDLKMEEQHSSKDRDDNRRVAAKAEVRDSIKDRLAALRKSQSEDWKQRMERVKSVDDLKGDPVDEVDNTSGHMVVCEQVTATPKILSRVFLLESSQNEWRKRVEEKDATTFTVAGKLGKVGKCAGGESLSPDVSTVGSPNKKRLPKLVRFQSKMASIMDLKASGSSATSSHPSPRISSLSRSRSMPMPPRPPHSDASKDQSVEHKNPLAAVMIPTLDDESFTSFFHATDVASLQSQKLEIDEEDFDRIACESKQLLVHKRTVHVARRHVTARNPLKALATRSDLVQAEYLEVMTGVAETELKRLKVEQLAKHSDLATSALAGLVSTEDFKSVSLCRNSSLSSLPFAPHKDLMLLHIKGRRHVQTRLVEPNMSSLSEGDTFVLVKPNEVYNFIGEFSNVIERAKGAEVALVIQSRKDLGCTTCPDVITFDEEKRDESNDRWLSFCRLLGGEDVISEPSSAEEDELFETAIVSTNKVYTVEERELVPYEQYWGSSPRIEMLEPNKVLVFDFGTEMYVWQGKLASPELRKRAVRLAKELWDEGYDYTECDINPLNPLQHYHGTCALRYLSESASKRPAWALFGKINEHMETVLFREKFVDWPDMQRVIRVKREDSVKSESSTELQPCDAKIMFEGIQNVEPDLILEGSHLGRGLSYWDEVEKRCSQVITLGIKVWHVLEYNHNVLPLECWGQFHSEDTYVVRWQYRVSVAGRRLGGQASKHSTLGRERCAYFFWQGSDSTINEKGASALMTVELDEERGPHVRVVQGQEPPSFLNLFKGGMIVHRGKRGEFTSEKWRLFVVRGDHDGEAHLLELKLCIEYLRSRGVYILLNRVTGVIYFWVGSKASSQHTQAARAAVTLIHERQPLDLGFKHGATVVVEDQFEGNESESFWNVFGSKIKGERRPSHLSFVDAEDCRAFDFTPRLFHMTSTLGVFSASEVICTFNSRKRICTFPFLQTDLYKSAQPDNESEVYVWQGWWPEGIDDNGNTATGSAHLRFNVERRFAMETALEYCEVKDPQCSPPAYAIWAGLEPLEFQNIFPFWELRQDIAAILTKDGKKEGDKRLIDDVLRQLKTTRYSYSELQARPLPEGVDPSILESYLSNEDFERVLKMTKKEFYALPQWKQYNVKKTVGLFY